MTDVTDAAAAFRQGKLDAGVTKEDQEILLEALRSWGALDKNYTYTPVPASEFRGWDRPRGGGAGGGMHRE